MHWVHIHRIIKIKAKGYRIVTLVLLEFVVLEMGSENQSLTMPGGVLDSTGPGFSKFSSPVMLQVFRDSLSDLVR